MVTEQYIADACTKVGKAFSRNNLLATLLRTSRTERIVIINGNYSNDIFTPPGCVAGHLTLLMLYIYQHLTS